MKITINLPDSEVRRLKGHMKALEIPASAFVPFITEWIEQTTYDEGALTDTYTYPDRKTARRVAMRELANDGFRLTLNYWRDGKTVVETFYPPYAQKLLNAGKRIRFVDRADGPGRWLMVKGPVETAITAFVAPDIKAALEARAQERGIDMSKFIRSALWDQNADLDISDPPERRGPWKRRSSKSSQITRG